MLAETSASHGSLNWKGRTVYLIGGGPSLKGFDFARLRRRGVVVAINDALLSVPWADASFTIDLVWLRNRIWPLAAFLGERIAMVPDGWVPPPPLTLECFKTYLRTDEASGGNSGYAALAVALHRGAARVALLGYDMSGPGHWHKGYDWQSRFGAADYPRWRQQFHLLAYAAQQRGVRVINCNPKSGIKYFPHAAWDSVAE